MSQNLTYKKFGDVASFSRGLTFAKGDVATGSSKKVLRSNNIDLQTHTLNFDDVACLKEEFIIPNEKKLHKGDIFICMSNGSTQHLGKVAFIDKDMDYAFGGFMGVIHPDNTTIYPKYAFYACLSSEYRRFLASIFNGININNLKWSDLSNLQIPIPTLQEQERIVAELDLLTGIIEKQKQQLKELDTLAQSIFYDMFGNPDTNSKGWLVKKLGELCKSDLGKTLNASKDTGKMRPYLCAINIHWNEIDLSTLKQTKFDDEELERYSVVKGDLLVCEGGDVGRSAIWKEDKVIQYQNALHRIRFGKKIIAIYCLFVLQYLKVNGILDGRYGKGVTIKHLVKSSLLSIPIPVPPLELQESFAKKIQAIESQKESINRSIAESQKLFDYTMDKYFG